MTPRQTCSVCRAPFKRIVTITGLRRSNCEACGHSERIDIERFDYVNHAMGLSGVATDRLTSQADFLAPHLRTGLRAIEIGCASGDLAEALRARVSFARYDGVEFSPSRAAAMKRLDHVYDRPLDELISSGKVERAAYDLALASHCLEHVEDPGALIDAMRDALAPDGALFIEVPNRSGHPRFAFDDNRSHLHFFSVASLSRLLIDRGFQIEAAMTGARFDARYVDSIRAVARRPAGAGVVRLLSDDPALAGVDQVAVWGAGRMVDEVLAHVFDAARIAYFVDRDPAKQGGALLGKPIVAPAALREDSGRVVLINSLEMEPAIRAQIAADFGDLKLRVIGIAQLMED